MKKCECCGKMFDPEVACDEFESETYLLNYDHFIKPLCGPCAVRVINERIDGVYFETCEKCGKKFDLILEEDHFERLFYPRLQEIHLRSYWKEGIRCAECAAELVDL